MNKPGDGPFVSKGSIRRTSKGGLHSRLKRALKRQREQGTQLSPKTLWMLEEVNRRDTDEITSQMGVLPYIL